MELELWEKHVSELFSNFGVWSELFWHFGKIRKWNLNFGKNTFWNFLRNFYFFPSSGSCSRRCTSQPFRRHRDSRLPKMSMRAEEHIRRPDGACRPEDWDVDRLPQEPEDGTKIKVPKKVPKRVFPKVQVPFSDFSKVPKKFGPNTKVRKFHRKFRKEFGK